MIGFGDPIRSALAEGNELVFTAPFVNRWMPSRGADLRRPRPVSVAIQKHPDATADDAAVNAVRETLEAGEGALAMQNFCIRLKNPTLIGERALIPCCSGVVITDSAHRYHTAEIYRSADRRDFEFLHLGFDGQSFFPTLGADRLVHHEGSTALLASMEQGNYGAFLLRTVAKLAALRRLGIDPDRYFVSTDASWQVRILEVFGVDSAKLLSYDRFKAHVFEDLYVPNLPTSEFVPDDMTIDFFVEVSERLKVSDLVTTRPSKIYVSRLRAARERPHYRVCQNEAELVSRLRDFGFHIYEPESDTIENQIRTFAAAEIVVGASGAGMFNTIFCPPQTKIVSIEPMMNWTILHANMYAGFGHPYVMVLGGADPADSSSQRRWVADVELIIDQIKSFM
ncbi:glycosyltransferase family 61 protein [Methylobacterium sp. J-068]|uniref:glycosyltransferase family 61 protein n=1 Tax=Methylobacterium sp. J-068 TaxID=2836649 RepID=UPI001FBA112D|nr:glycosyltransferase 61 family protein [Methylobacterium sp. J-068]MCJ2033437.1 glycosyltransferase family 61 protein [Methylobacterium sp. J-068]